MISASAVYTRQQPSPLCNVNRNEHRHQHPDRPEGQEGLAACTRSHSTRNGKARERPAMESRHSRLRPYRDQKSQTEHRLDPPGHSGNRAAMALGTIVAVEAEPGLQHGL